MAEEINEDKMSAIEQLLNPDNNDNVLLFNERKEAVEFEQVAIIPHDDVLYAILKPIDQFDGIEDDEAIVFSITEDESTGEYFLDVEQDDVIIDAVFDKYYKLFDESNAE